MTKYVVGDFPEEFFAGDLGKPVWTNPGLIAPIMQNVQNMTKRELFAGLAMCGMLAAGNSAGVAFHAVEHADKLIKELEGTK